MQNNSRMYYLQTVLGYDQMIVERVYAGGWQPYFVNFMFAQMSGKASAKIAQMTAEVIRAYATLVPHVVRKPRSPKWTNVLPIFIGAPDLPVPKNKKHSKREVTLNDGLHFNGCLLLPPAERCRLRGSLTTHFIKKSKMYCLPERPLERIHAERMSTPIIADYIFKQLKRGNISSDDILILPRSISEMPKPRLVHNWQNGDHQNRF